MTVERDYRALVEGVRRRVAEAVPADGRVLVVSRGDDALLRLPGCRASHFPQSATGLYAGFHPGDGAEATAHLAALRERDAEYLVVPATAAWWLDHYTELREELESRGECLVDDPQTCAIYALVRQKDEPPRLTREELEAARTAPQAAALVDALLPEGEGVALVGAAVPAVDAGARPCWRIPAPGVETSVGEVLARVREARAAGARYVVLVHADAAARQLDGAVRRELAASLRPVFRQVLAEGFEFAHGGLRTGV